MAAALRLVRSRCAIAAALLLAAPVGAQPDNSLASVVPADVGMYIEIRRGADLILPLTEPPLWSALSELTGEPARESDSALWARVVRETIGMSPQDAVRTLLTQRVAFASDRWLRTQDAIVACRPQNSPRQIMRGWPARPLPAAGRASVYQLPHGVGLAVVDGVMVFGDRASTRLFPSVLRLVETRSTASLADDPAYRGLLARVGFEPDGVAFARHATPSVVQATTASQPATQSQPAGADASPSPLFSTLYPGARAVLLAVRREGPRLRVSVVSDAPPLSPRDADADALALAAQLPARSLLAWAGPIDRPLVEEAIRRLPERHVLRVLHALHERSGVTARLFAALRGSAGLALGVVERDGRDTPPTPALAILLPLRDEAGAAEAWGAMVDSSLSIYRLMSLRLGQPMRTAGPRVVSIEGVEAHAVDLSAALEQAGLILPDSLHMAWALDGDTLIIATHTDWLRQVLAARRDAPKLDRAIAALHAPGGDALLIAQTGPLGDLGALWLDHLARTAPHVLSESYWRRLQPSGDVPRMGVQVTADNDARRLVVRTITAGSPADGVLKPGDVIVGANRQRFATTQPVDEMQAMLTSRPDARWVELLIERGHVARLQRVPLPFVDPVLALQRVVSVGALVQRVAYSEIRPVDAGPRGEITIELRGGAAPLFAFGAPTSGGGDEPSRAPGDKE